MGIKYKMSQLRKITLMSGLFIVLTTMTAMGAFYLFDSLGDSMSTIYPEIEKDVINDEMRIVIVDISDSFQKLYSTGGRVEFRRKYNAQKGRLLELLSNLTANYRDRVEVEVLEDLVRKYIKYTDDRTVRGTDLDLADLSEVVMRKDDLIDNLTKIHYDSMNFAKKNIESSIGLRQRLRLNLYLIFGGTMLFSVLLMILVRRLVEEPVSLMLNATEHISTGDLSYRIDSERQDEFGVIYDRFNAMVDGLERTNTGLNRKLSQMELLLTVARATELDPGMEEALKHIASSINTHMRKDLCAVFSFTPQAGFMLLACNEASGKPCDELALRSEVIERSVIERGGFISMSPGDVLKGGAGMSSAIVVPVLHKNDFKGVLVICSALEDGCQAEDMDTALIIAHSIGNIIMNFGLHEEVKSQLEQISVMYELGVSMTGLYELNELLDTATSKVSKLLGASGCIIRLIEGDELIVMSSYGLVVEQKDETPVKLGTGIPGWVAQNGRPFIANDVDDLPENMRFPRLATKCAVVVPLKKADQIIGTLGVFDKKDASGSIIPFGINDVKVLEGFASLSAIAIDKARRHEREERIEHEMQKTEKRLELLFESVQNGIITLDRNYTIISANKYIERWVDTPHKDLLLKDAREVFHGQGGVCPHCAARVTFEEGDVNSITQSSGLNYADLTSYPVRDASGNIIECIVLVQDITDRVLYQEEIMGLYREVMQTKEYMESLIRNSADAIVTTDLEGVVQSWNPSAHQIYGYEREDVLGRYVPYVPESLITTEKSNLERIKRGEVLKLESLRRRKDGAIIEVNMAISPIKDVSGEIIGASYISRDISDKKRVEKELIRRNQELSRLFFISSAMRGTLELDKLLRMVLTAVTMSDGLGFNRALLFTLDEDRGVLKAVMGEGPADYDEAMRIWSELSTQHRTLHDIMQEIEEGDMPHDSLIKKINLDLEIPLSEDTVLTRTARTKSVINVQRLDSGLPVDQALVDRLGTESYATVPLISRGRVIGVLWVDNKFNRRPITDEDMKFLMGFADQVASAIEAARLFQQVSLAEAELENIFSSISDMVYMTDRDFTIKNVNQAVMDKVGLSREQIIGRKCFKIFHGMDEPWPMCPHHKTVETLEPSIEEYEDPHLGGTYLSSTAPMFNTERKFLGTVHVVRDVSEIQDLRVKLQSAERKAALGEVAAKVAHEIRNPLVSVGGFAKRLESKLDGNLKEYASIIATEVGRLELILKDILGFVRDVRMDRRDVDMNKIVSGLLDLLQTLFMEKNNAMNDETSKHPIMLYVDPDRVREAFMNIIVNANQATEGGTITIRTYQIGKFGVLEVDDTGHGIDRRDFKRIFDPFYTTRPTGTGLGLAVSKRIIEENEGNIEVLSERPGGGSVFKVYLPLKEAGK